MVVYCMVVRVCSVLYCIILYYIILYYIILYYIILYYIILYYIILYYIILYYIILYCIVLYCIVLYCIVLYCIVLYCVVLYCIVLYRIVLYCAAHRRIVPHCTVHCPAMYGSIDFSASSIPPNERLVIIATIPTLARRSLYSTALYAYIARFSTNKNQKMYHLPHLRYTSKTIISKPQTTRTLPIAERFFDIIGVVSSIGSGNMIVEFFSAAMAFNVCKYRSCRA